MQKARIHGSCLVFFVAGMLFVQSMAGCDSEKSWQMDLRACVFAASCPTNMLGWDTINNICTGYIYDALLAERARGDEAANWEAIYACKNRATNCEEYVSCITLSQEDKVLCKSTDVGGYCLDGTSIMCPGPDFHWPEDGPVSTARWDCTQAGLFCNEGPASFGCGTGDCDPESDESSCDGDLLTVCSEAGQIQTVDCKDRLFYTYDPEIGPRMVASNSCGDQSDGQPGCVGAGESCEEASFSGRCDGHFLVSCTGGKVARVDCRRLIPGTTCSEESSYGLACVPENPECDTESDCSRQDGVVTFCAFGEVQSVDCHDLGFSGCSVFPSLSGRVTARCVMDE